MVYRFKYSLLKLFLCVEVVFFATIYFYGSFGVRTTHQLQQEITVLEKDISVINHAIAQLQQELCAWTQHDFYKEKMAREQLQMAYKGETIYYVS